MSVNRREFLGGTVACGLALPPFLKRAAAAAPKADQPGGDETVLVVVQLSGGNDGLNTVVPFADPEYRRQRPKLGLRTDDLLKVDEELGLHPALQGFADLLEQTRLSIVQGVGYPNATRSHFESMDVWHRATPDETEKFGWLGRARARLGGNGAVYVGGNDSPLALFNATGNPLTVQSLAEHQLPLTGERGRRVRAALDELVADGTPGGHELLEIARSASKSMLDAEKRFRRASETSRSASAWPNSGLAKRLEVIAQLLRADSPERIFYTSLDGFDTHSGQAPAHERLLREVAEAIAAFQRDLESQGQHRRVLILTFSEFGRRVKENGSEGTDHGAASQMFLVGEGLRGGPIGDHPSLTDLDQGDLKFHTDFRSVYQTILEDWLRAPGRDVLLGDFPKVELFSA